MLVDNSILSFCSVGQGFDQIREASELKNDTKSGKVHNFLDPPLPQDVLDFFEFGKNSKFDDPPLWPNLGKVWNWENFEFWEPPLRIKT